MTDPITAQAVTQTAQQVAQQAAPVGKSLFGGIMRTLVNAPMGFVKGAFNGAISSGLMLGGVFSGVMLFAPDLARSLAKAVGGDALASKIGNLGDNPEAGSSLWQRLALGMGGGMAVGGALGGAGGLVNGVANSFTSGNDVKTHGNNLGAVVVGGGLALLVGSVAIGALVKNGVVTPGGDHAAATPPAPTPPSKAASQPVRNA